MYFLYVKWIFTYQSSNQINHIYTYGHSLISKFNYIFPVTFIIISWEYTRTDLAKLAGLSSGHSQRSKYVWAEIYRRSAVTCQEMINIQSQVSGNMSQAEIKSVRLRIKLKQTVSCFLKLWLARLGRLTPWEWHVNTVQSDEAPPTHTTEMLRHVTVTALLHLALSAPDLGHLDSQEFLGDQISLVMIGENSDGNEQYPAPERLKRSFYR